MTRTYERGLRLVFGVLAVAAVVSLSGAGPHASVPWIAACGEYLTGNETYVLTADVLDCNTIPAITVVGPARLKLNGHTVSCELGDDGVTEGTIGIKLEGTAAALIGGGRAVRARGETPTNLVMGCDQGVVLADDGNHRVEGVTVTLSKHGAFVVDSDDNNLIGNVVRQVKAWGNSDPLEGSGFLISGDKNRLLGNVAADVDSEDEAGFTIEGTFNFLEDNISKDNVGYGYLVQGNANVLRHNSALKNEQHGFHVEADASENLLKFNKSFENGDEPAQGLAASGFYVEGSRNRLDANLATRNGMFGIHLGESASYNVVSGNRVSDSFGLPDGFDSDGDPVGTGGDLIDESFDCGTNQWKENVFGTRNARCIK